MTRQQLTKFHRVALVVWFGPGLIISVLIALFTGQKIILIWNLALSVYAIVLVHFLGSRQEQNSDGL